MPETPFNKVVGLRCSILLKKSLWHRCFPVDFAKFLKTPFSTEDLQWLLLEDIIRRKTSHMKYKQTSSSLDQKRSHK